MRTAPKIVGFLALALILAAAGSTAAVWLGWIVLPTPVLQAAAAARGLPPDQVPTLEKAARVYRTLRSSPAGSYVDSALALAPRTQDPAAWRDLAVHAWPELDPATLEALRTDLGVPKDEWDQVVAVVSTQVARAAAGQEFDLPAADARRLNRFAEDTGLLELVRSLSGK